VASDDAFLARAPVLRALEALGRPPATLEENGLARVVRALLVLPRCGGRRALGKGRKAHRGPCGLPAMIPAQTPAWRGSGMAHPWNSSPCMACRADGFGSHSGSENHARSNSESLAGRAARIPFRPVLQNLGHPALHVARDVHAARTAVDMPESETGICHGWIIQNWNKPCGMTWRRIFDRFVARLLSKRVYTIKISIALQRGKPHQMRFRARWRPVSGQVPSPPSMKLSDGF